MSDFIVSRLMHDVQKQAEQDEGGGVVVVINTSMADKIREVYRQGDRVMLRNLYGITVHTVDGGAVPEYEILASIKRVKEGAWDG